MKLDTIHSPGAQKKKNNKKKENEDKLYLILFLIIYVQTFIITIYIKYAIKC